MAYEIQYKGYVKFVRGTVNAWNSVTTKDPDTLYFISDEGSTRGTLYLGEKLIAGEHETFNLSDLTDVLISNDVSTNSLLIYDEEEGKWVNKKLSDIISLYVDVMEGATAEKNGASGLVPAPLIGQQNLFLQGNGTWADPTAALTEQVNGLDAKVGALDTTLGTLVGTDTNKSIREIAQSEVSTVVGGASEAFDTLLEVEQWINNNGDVSEVAGLTANVARLEDTVFGKAANPEAGTEEVVGLVTIVSDLKDTVNGNEDKGIVGLQPQVDNIKIRVDGIDTTLAEMDNRLRWQALVETTTE